MHTHWRSAADWKRQGLYLSTASDEACKLYDALITQYIGWYDDASLNGITGTLEKLKAADPNFVMGQVVANGLELLGTGRNIKLDADLKADITRMVRLGNSPEITLRERKHVAALELWAQGSTDQACNVWEEILVDHPHDILALKFAHDTYFYLGYSYQLRDSVARVLPFWKSTAPLYGYVLGMHSFGLEETNLYLEAETVARKALSINPRDGWATHTLCHVMEMTGRHYEGIHMMEKTNYWKTCEMLACHNLWHLSLYYVEIGNYDSALSLFDEEISRRASKSGAMLDLVDVCSLLYRLEMEGVDIGNRWDNVYSACSNHLNDHVLAFNDLHFLMACLGANQKTAVADMMISIQDYLSKGHGRNKEVTAEVGDALLKAFIAYNDGEFSTAVGHVHPIRYKVNMIGGSHAQRDLISLFLIQSAIKSHKKEHHLLARALVNERKLWKRTSPMTDRLMAKALDVQSISSSVS